MGECYVVAFDFTAVGLPAFSFDFPAIADLDVSLGTIPDFDLVSPAEVYEAASALDAAVVHWADN